MGVIMVKIILSQLASFPKGSFSAIIGPSGAGKSTLIRCINRLVEPSTPTCVVAKSGENAMDHMTAVVRSLTVYPLTNAPTLSNNVSASVIGRAIHSLGSATGEL